MIEKIGKVLKSNGAKSIAVQGIAIPIIGTVVGFYAQKFLINREQKKVQQQKASTQHEAGEVVKVSDI